MKKILNDKFLIILLVLIVPGFVKGDSDIYQKMARGIDIFGRVFKEVSLNYVDEIDPEKFMIAGVEGMLDALDPYTGYIDESNLQDIELFTTGKYGGIGVTVGLREGRVTIVDLLEGYSAQRQGLRIGDEIAEINGVKIDSKKYEELSKYMKGEPGTMVSITINRPGIDDPLKFEILREEIIIKNVTFADFYPVGSNNLYIKLSGFTRTAGDEIKQVYFQKKDVREIRSVILDLRGNPGGLLDAAIDVCEKFLPKGKLIVSVKGRDTTRTDRYLSAEEPLMGKTKLVVLIDANSASASEIVAGALQDHDRGLIVGENSFGKGLVQTVSPLPYNRSLKMTTGKYFTPSGRCIQKVDYSTDNDIFLIKSKMVDKSYLTANGRKVFDHGGIKPDSTVSDKIESGFVQDLIAKGMFFKFSTDYFNKTSPGKDEINNESLFDSFKNYINNEKFQYQSGSMKILKQLSVEVKKDHYNGNISNKLKEMEAEIRNAELTELEKNKTLIVSLIRIELKSRIKGYAGRINELLTNDIQLKTALSLVNNENIYNKLLTN